MFIVASPDPNPRGGGQLPNPNECNSMLTSATRGETLTSNPKCNSMLMSGTSGGAAPTYTIYIYILQKGVNYLTLRVQFYANECNEGRSANP